MKKITFISFMLCLLITLTVSAKPSTQNRVNKKQLTKERISKIKEKRALTSKRSAVKPVAKATNAVVLFEDFSKFTAGSEATPDATQFYGVIPSAYTSMPDWEGYGVYQAGGVAYLGTYEEDEEILGGEIYTPYLDLSANSGKYTVKFRAKSESSEGDFFFVYWDDGSDEEEPYEVFEITDDWAEYSVDLSNGVGDIYFAFFSYFENSFIDDIQIIQDGGSVALGTPVAADATAIGATNFTANWSAVEGATSYVLDVYTKEEGQGEVTVLSENFGGFAAGQPNAQADGTDVAGTLDQYTQMPGWTGVKVFQAGGTIKMGTSSVLGSITTPAIDLSASGGSFKLSFDAMAWNKEPASVNIYVNDVKVTMVEGLDNSGSYVMAPFSCDLTGGTASTKIKFEGTANKARFFIDNVVITQDGTSLIPVPVAGSPFTVTTNSHQVTGLNPLTEYFYTVVAKNDTETSAKSNEKPVTTLGGSGMDLTVVKNSIFVNGNLHVVLDAANVIEVYTVSGVLVNRVNGVAGDNEIALPQQGIYVVKAGNAIAKVIK